MPLLNWVAIVFYIVGICVCALAVHAATTSGRPVADARAWMVAVAVFVVLAGMRAFQLEELLRDGLRTLLHAEGEYGKRRAFQAPLAVAVLAMLLPLALLAHRLWQRTAPGAGTRLVLAAQLGMVGLALLYAMRIISLHFIDKLLYGGGVHLNWFLEGGLTLLIGGPAALYVLRSRRMLQVPPDHHRFRKDPAHRDRR